MNTSDFDYELPAELIAQRPPARRDDSRMLVLHRQSGALEHRTIRDLPGYLAPGDLLTVNNTRVFPARIFGERDDTGGKVELLLVEEVRPGDAEGGSSSACNANWNALCRSGFKPRAGIKLRLAQGRIRGEVLREGDEGMIGVRLSSDHPLMEVLETEGVAPVPPYIARAGEPELTASDRERYQTIYAEHTGAVAAPTAGLHFTAELLDELQHRGVRRAAVTLHVGPGTFKPVKAGRLEDHKMEEERYSVSRETADAIRAAKRAGHRVVAVGTTTVRTLETVAREQGTVQACAGRSSLFVYPPCRFRVVDAMLTNFHLPMSTLIMLVSAFAAPGEVDRGRERVLRAYREAIEQRYRFYSYGDCMLLI